MGQKSKWSVCTQENPRKDFYIETSRKSDAVNDTYRVKMKPLMFDGRVVLVTGAGGGQFTFIHFINAYEYKPSKLL